MTDVDNKCQRLIMTDVDNDRCW